jgi:hypothetical protein
MAPAPTTRTGGVRSLRLCLTLEPHRDKLAGALHVLRHQLARGLLVAFLDRGADAAVLLDVVAQQA